MQNAVFYSRYVLNEDTSWHTASEITWEHKQTNKSEHNDTQIRYYIKFVGGKFLYSKKKNMRKNYVYYINYVKILREKSDGLPVNPKYLPYFMKNLWMVTLLFIISFSLIIANSLMWTSDYYWIIENVSMGCQSIRENSSMWSIG